MGSVSEYIRRHHLGLIAVFIAMTGTAWAGAQVESQDIAKNAVRGKHVKNGQIGTKDIADGTTSKGLTGADVVANSLTTEDVAEGTLFNDNSLDAADVADSSLTTAEVDESTLFNDDSLGAADIGGGSVGSSEVADDGVGAAEIATGAVASPEVLNDSLTVSDIVNNGGIDADIDGSFGAGDPPAPGNDQAFFQVIDDVVATGSSGLGGSAAVWNVNTATGHMNMAGDIHLDNGWIQLDEIPDPTDPLQNSGRLYVREDPGAGNETQLVIEWRDGTEDVLAVGPVN